MDNAETVSHSSRRDPALDAIRALAIVMVVGTHAASSGILLPVGTADWWGALVWGVLVRSSVPLFFMCSGALMLNRDISLKRLYGHNLVRILAAMYFWAFLYRLYHLVIPGGAGLTLSTLVDAVKKTLVLNHEFHFYFLHILILVYVMLPILRVLTRSASRQELRYALVVWFALGIALPLLQNVWPFTLVYAVSSYYVLNASLSSVGYAFMGWYLRRYGREISPKWYVASFVLGAVITYGGTAVMSLSAGQLVERFLSGWSVGPMLMSSGVFGLLISVQSWSERWRRFLAWLSQASFCIYLVHVFFLYLLRHFGITASAGLPILSIPAITLVIIALSVLVYEVLRRVPIVKTYLI